MNKNGLQHCICAIGADKFGPSTFVILLNCINLAVILFFKATAKQTVGTSIPQQHKCVTVGSNCKMTRLNAI